MTLALAPGLAGSRSTGEAAADAGSTAGARVDVKRSADGRDAVGEVGQSGSTAGDAGIKPGAVVCVAEGPAFVLTFYLFLAFPMGRVDPPG